MTSGLAPSSGTGSVFVTTYRDGSWAAIWQGDDGDEADRHVTVDGDHDEVLAWARAQPAARHWIFDPEADRHLPLDPSG